MTAIDEIASVVMVVLLVWLFVSGDGSPLPAAMDC